MITIFCILFLHLQVTTDLTNSLNSWNRRNLITLKYRSAQKADPVSHTTNSHHDDEGRFVYTLGSRPLE